MAGRKVRILLAVAAALSHLHPAGAQEPASNSAVLLQVSAQNERAFAAWYVRPRGPVQLSWREASAEGAWRDSTVNGERAVISNLRNGITYEVRVIAAGGEGPSAVQRVTPRVRTDCEIAPYVFCDMQLARNYISELLTLSSDSDSPFICRAVEAPQLLDDARGCFYQTLRGPVLLNRALGSQLVRTSPLPQPSLVRAAVEEDLWGNNSPFGRPLAPQIRRSELRDSIYGFVSDTLFAHARSFLVEVQDRVYSRITRFEPPNPEKGRYAVYHEGHGPPGVESGAETIEWLLARGWTVYAVDMPLEGLNKVDRSYNYQTHADFARVGSAPYRGALDAFLLPLRVVVDEIYASSSPAEEFDDAITILMVGRSGGGWTISTYGLLDPRVTAVVNVAGAVPASIIAEPELAAFGDYEQLVVQSDAVPSDARLLAAGKRGVMFFYSTNDPCCFRIPPDHPWVLTIREAGAELNKIVDVFVDDHPEHGLSARGYKQLDRFLSRLGVNREENPARNTGSGSS